MADQEQDIVQEFSVTKLSGQRVVLKIDVKSDSFKYMRKGEVKHTCRIKDLNATLKDGLQIEIRIGTLKKILSAENELIREEILKTIQAAVEEQTPKQGYPLREGSRVIKEGFLMKKGNAVIEKWARRKVIIKQGVLFYYPENSEKRVDLSPVVECHVDAVGSDKFNVTVPGRTYSFQIPDSVRDKHEEQSEWIRCIRIAISDSSSEGQKIRKGSRKVLPDRDSRSSVKRRSVPRSPILKQGYLDKQGNATVKVWNVRFVKVEPGKLSYALPEKVENALNVIYLHESNACVISTKNYGFDVKVPNRVYHFRLLENTENRDEEFSAWMEALNKACSMKRSSELLEDLGIGDGFQEIDLSKPDVGGDIENHIDDSNRLTVMVPPGEQLNVIKKPTRPGVKKPTRQNLRKDSEDEPS
ncbi:uncharacterized protein LOC134244053 isoform X1 [Saccostrea cucullata]|uniref:uncharacterized protein LOC134244053 isoform X1 n=2 Tax=Saccostrea cuccullata TaxID=36930 RepID=UPI002ED58021